MLRKIIVFTSLGCAALALAYCTRVPGGGAAGPVSPPAKPEEAAAPAQPQPKPPVVAVAPHIESPKPNVPAAPAKPVDFTTLKGAFAGKFLIGTATDNANLQGNVLANVKANYNIITPENCMKPQPIHPSENQYNWGPADALLKFCENNNIQLHGHTLVWHSQTPNWFFQGANGQQATRDVVMERLHQHILTVVGHFKGRIFSWDVVNEAINDGGGAGENLRGSQWFRIIGPDFLTMAFKWAHEADPNAKLNYNDYNIEQGAANGNGKHASSMLLLKRLIKDGAPITGVGIQGHWHADTNLADVEKAIEDYASLGLKVSISELDVTATGTNSGALPGGGGRGGGAVTPEALKTQALVYAKLFDILNRHAANIERVTFWGINDRMSWRANQNPLLFDGQMQPKPAFQAILDVAAGKGLPQP